MCKSGNEMSQLYPAQEVLCFKAADDDLLRGFTVCLDNQPAIEVMLDIGDAFTVEDELSVGPEEVIAVQHVLQLIDGVLNGIILTVAGMQDDYTICSVYECQIGDFDRDHLFPVVHQDGLAIGTFHLGHDLIQTLLVGIEMVFDAVVFFQTTFYNCFFQWFEDVVDTIGFKGLDSVLVKGGTEDNGGIDRYFAIDFKAEAIA